MSAVNCPYCKNKVDIEYDGDYGREEGTSYTQECEHCKNIFVYTTDIVYYHTAYIAPCQNGKKHSFKSIICCPPELGEGIYRCEWCDAVEIDQEVHKKAVKRYLERMEVGE